MLYVADMPNEFTIVSVRLDNSVVDLLDLAAERGHRNRSGQIRLYLEQGLERDGMLERKRRPRLEKPDA